MKDALGTIESVLVLGGSSEIAQATVDKLIAERTTKVVLALRDPSTQKDYEKALLSRGVKVVDLVEFDADKTDNHEAFINSVFEKHGSFDVVLLAFGVLGEQENDEANPSDAVKILHTNFVGAASALLHSAKRLRQQGHGSLVVLSSVAGLRARAANFIYGASKAGLDAFCQGLGDSLVGSGVTLTIVRPGFVKTKMTAGMKSKPMASDPTEVADAIVEGIRKGKEVVWAPAKLQLVFTVLRHLPRPIFRKIKQ